MKFNELCKQFEKTNKKIISDNHRSLSGTEFMNEIKIAVKELESLGIGNKRMVLLRMTNNVEYVVMLFALLMTKSVVFIANPYDPIRKVCDTINSFAPFALLTDKPSALAVNKRIGAINACKTMSVGKGHIFANIFESNNCSVNNYDKRMEDADVAIFSSGATGEPKAILNGADNLLLNAKMHAESIGMQESDTTGIILPLYYSYGLVANLFSSFVTNAHVDLHPQTGTVDIDWLHKSEISVLSLTPYFSRTLEGNVPGLRVITLGGDVLHSKQALKVADRFPNCNLFATYGLTEAGPRCTTWKFDREILQTSLNAPIGNPLKGVSLFIYDKNKNSVNHGELVVETPTRMLGYFFGLQKGFTMPAWEDRKVYTEDLYERRNGHMFFVGREKHIIFQGGEKIYPLAIESAIQEVDGVFEARVISVNDEEKGNIAKALIVADKKVNLKTIRRGLLSRFSHSLIPEKFEFVSAISRTLAGKVA